MSFSKARSKLILRRVYISLYLLSSLSLSERIIDADSGIDSFYPGPYYSFYELPTKPQVAAALDLLDEAIDDEGPFDGVIGFSQGAALAASYMLQDAKRVSPRHPFKCAVFFCASMPFDLDSSPFTIAPDGTARLVGSNQRISAAEVRVSIPEASTTSAGGGYAGRWDAETPFLWRYQPSRTIKPRITIPTTHIWAANDRAYRQQSMQLRQLCLPQHQQVVEHRGGHDIPRDRSTTARMVQSIQNMLHAVMVG